MKSRIIAVTGKIGSGKSSVTKYLSELGYMTIDCDQISRDVGNRPDIVDKVGKYLGEQFVEGGRLNRGMIRNAVFVNEGLWAGYTDIFATAVYDILLEKLQDCELAFVEIQTPEQVDYPWYAVWRVECNEKTRVDRAIYRDKTTKENIDAISSRQKPINNATYTIDNSGDIDQLHNAIDILLAKMDI